MSKADFRYLNTLVETASTARVLNLARRPAALRAATAPERRLFRTAALDRAVLTKHKLRPHERDQFVAAKSPATKVLVPIDPLDLDFGAHAVMVDQKGYDEVLVGSLAIDTNPDDGTHDRAVLAALDEMPSLDPFLIREHLARRGFKVADDYFDISPADVVRMTAFVRKDIAPLVSLCLGAAACPQQVEIFSQKLLAAELDASMDPLRITLKMNAEQFVEGVFCWKGFLYYKWVLNEVNGGVGAMTHGLGEVKAVGEANPDHVAYVAAARGRIKVAIRTTCREVQTSLLTYDRAFEKLTKKADPGSFRDFLLGAPRTFFEVGEKLGAVQHVISVWTSRFAGCVGPLQTPARELLDMLSGFEENLAAAPQAARSWVV